jgi:hypothetical protein
MKRSLIQPEIRSQPPAHRSLRPGGRSEVSIPSPISKFAEGRIRRGRLRASPGLFNVRALLALTLSLAGATLAMFSLQAQPPGATSGPNASTSSTAGTATVSPPLLPAISPPGICSSAFPMTPLVTLPSGQLISCPSQVSQALVSSSQLPQPCVVPGVDDWCWAWSSQYDGPAQKADSPGNLTSIHPTATSPDGKLVFIAGTSDQNPSSGATNNQVVTIAYDSSTGNVVWTTPYLAPDGFQSLAQSLAVGGSRVFVVEFENNHIQLVSRTIAYDATSGNPIWTAPALDKNGFAKTVAASADGARVYVTGSTVVKLPDGTYHIDATTIAYDGATGAQLWVASVPGPTGAPPPGFADGFGVAAVGGKVFMAVRQSDAQAYSHELDLLVIDGITGQTLVTGSRPIHADDEVGLTVSADGSRAFMEVQDLPVDSSGTTHGVMGVVAFDAKTGQSLWLADYFGPNPTGSLQSGSIPWMWGPIATSPDGSRVFAATESVDGDFGLAGTGFTTVAYDGASGTQLWIAEYNTNTPVNYIFAGPMVTIDPAGRAVYVTGPAEQAETFATIAYDPATGAPFKTGMYTSAPGESNAFTISPDGSRVFVGAISTSSVNTSTDSTNSDIVALRYDTGLVPLPSVVSRMTHGSAGTFDIDLPLSGSPGIECRSAGANGDYTMVFTFLNALTSVGNARVTSGTGSVSSSNIDSNDAHNYIVNVTGVTNAQVLKVDLTNVTDSAGNFSSSVSVSMSVLLGDVDATGRVDGNDVSAVQSHTRQATDSNNYRYDVDATGRIDGNDVSITQGKTRTSLP